MNQKTVSYEKILKKRRKIRTREERKNFLKWTLIIIISALLIILIANFIFPLFEKIDIKDTTYDPRDLERAYKELHQTRSTPK